MESNLIPLLRKQLLIERLGGKFITRKYDLCQHSYGVTVLFIDICHRYDIDINSSVIDAVLKHDILETITLDLPYPVKNLSSKTQKAWEVIERECVENSDYNLFLYLDISALLTEQQYEIFKICDALELWMFCIEERRNGNANTDIREVADKCVELIGDKYPYVRQLMHEF